MNVLSRAGELWRRSRRAIDQPRAELEGFPRTVRYLYDLTRHAVGQLNRHRSFLMAAALSYRTLFSLVPVLVLVLVVLNQVYGEQGFRQAFGSITEYLGLAQIEVQVEERSTGPDGEVQVEQVTQTVDGVLNDFINNAVSRVSDVSFTGVAIVGMLVFIWAAISLLVEIEAAFNASVETNSMRKWSRKIPTYWTLLTLGALLLPLSFVAGTYFNARLDELPTWAAFIATPVRIFVQVATTWLVMLAAYVWMPVARVSLASAAIGALVAALLWETGKSLLTGAIPQMLEGQLAIYGSLALVPMLLFWVYITWLIVLFGLELAYAIQTLDESQLRQHRKTGPEVTPVLEPLGMSALAAHLAYDFERGKAPSVAELSREAQVSSGAAQVALAAFERAGIARRVSDGVESSSNDADERASTESRYTLARPADQVLLSEVLTSVRDPHQQTPGDDSLEPVVMRMTDACGGLTLATLAERLRDASTGAAERDASLGGVGEPGHAEVLASRGGGG